MRQIIRNCTFETNSSSMHSISIMNYVNPDELNELNYHIEFGDYGWEHVEYDEPFDILTYLYTLAHCGDIDKCREHIAKIKEWCPNCSFKEAEIEHSNFGKGYDYFAIDGYVDHSGDYDRDEIFKDKERFANIVLGGLIRTSNDNCDDYDDLMSWLTPKDAKLVIHKGN